MKVHVFYSGKTGFTKRYAEWIAQELGCRARLYSDFAETAIGAEDLVIFGGRLHAGRVERLKAVTSRLRDNLIVFAVGAAPAAAESTVEKYWRENLTAEERAVIPHFYMQGGLNFPEMGFMDRTIMHVVALLMKGKQQEPGVGIDFGASFDAASKDALTPLLSCANDRMRG